MRNISINKKILSEISPNNLYLAPVAVEYEGGGVYFGGGSSTALVCGVVVIAFPVSGSAAVASVVSLLLVDIASSDGR